MHQHLYSESYMYKDRSSATVQLRTFIVSYRPQCDVCALPIFFVRLRMQMAESIEYDFVERPTQDHFCVVTLELLRDPHQTTCCGHHLSQEAASRLQRDGKPCPMCQRPNLSTVPDLYFRRKVNEINVRCPQKSQGCKWVGEVGGLDRHLGSQCLWVRVSCPKSCGGSVLRGNLPLHLDADCPKRNYRCKYCQFQATYEVVQKQHIPQCPK